MGNSWEGVANELAEPFVVVRAWPQQFAGVWRTHFEQAKRDVCDAPGLEGLAKLRTLLRSDDEKIRRDCAKELATQTSIERGERPRRESDFHRIAAYLEGFNDDELRNLLAQEGIGNSESPA